MMARPTKLNKKVQERIGKAIEDMMPYDTAAQLAGITYHTFNEWMKKGAAGKQPYDKFYNYIKECEARGEENLLKSITAAGGDSKSWQANAWILERRYPKKWGKTTYSETKIEGNLNHTIKEMTDEELERSATEILERRADDTE